MVVHCMLEEDNFGDVRHDICEGYLYAVAANRGEEVQVLSRATQVTDIPNTVLWVSQKMYDSLNVQQLCDHTSVEIIEEPSHRFFRNRVEEVLAPLGA